MSPGEMPCIRCGDCAAACPVRLQPQQLWLDLRAGDLLRADQHGLAECTACGLCDAVCPSHIALRERFVAGQLTLAEHAHQQHQAGAARDRFQRRNQRLQRESLERAEREAAMTVNAASTDAVAAAIERAKARRQQSRDKP